MYVEPGALANGCCAPKSRHFTRPALPPPPRRPTPIGTREHRQTDRPGRHFRDGANYFDAERTPAIRSRSPSGSTGGLLCRGNDRADQWRAASLRALAPVRNACPGPNRADTRRAGERQRHFQHLEGYDVYRTRRMAARRDCGRQHGHSCDALVREFVKLRGGSVTAHSAGPGQGSEFTVRLPTES